MFSLVLAMALQTPAQAPPVQSTVNQYSLWKDGQRIGTSVQVVESIIYNEKPSRWYRSATDTMHAFSRYEAVLDETGLPLQMAVEVQTRTSTLITRAVLTSQGYRIASSSGGRAFYGMTTVKIKDPALLRADATTAVLVNGKVSVTDRRYQTLDLGSRSIVDGQMIVVGKVEVAGQPVHKVNVFTGKSKSILYVGESGKVLQIEAPDGTTMRAEEATEEGLLLVGGPSLLR